MQNQFKLGTREILAIILISLGTKFTDVTPDLLFAETYMASWMVPLIAGSIVFLPLFLFVKLINKYKLSLVDLNVRLTGKYVGNIINLILFAFSLIGTALMLSNYSDILMTLYFPQTPKLVLHFVLTLVCLLVAYGGAYMVGRTAWIVLPYIKLALLVLIILTLSEELNLSYLFPFFGTGIDVVLKESFLQNSIYIELILFAALIPYVRDSKNYSKAVLWGLWVVALEMSIFYFFYIIVFDAYSLKNMLLPFQHLARAVELGRFISNFEGYFLAFWIVGSIVKFATYFFITTTIFTQTIKKVKFTKIYIIPIAAVIFVIGIIPETIVHAAFSYRQMSLYVGSYIFVTLPIILWILSFRKKASVAS
ncbi:hypothetical protein EJF36_13030 [Bacillus sp. HMF5848]|uniref:GerAB/ArcD/ProY family transporter n=1 Tax=Bacillus sp. HMF5848 TaxID=2495421 RepID=UPI000F7AD93A|nr:endospore germination permease [Bacillus sp. HMF5848]RSK27723.1 hypothetical protein EJF36_13030 [Bacillus sp. HMF5848]